MANKARPATFSAILLIFLLLANYSETTRTISKDLLCERPSQTWSGKCGNTQHCDNQCQQWEHAQHGACHQRNGWKCFCYFDHC